MRRITALTALVGLVHLTTLDARTECTRHEPRAAQAEATRHESGGPRARTTAIPSLIIA